MLHDQQVGQTVLRCGSVSVLQIEICDRWPLLWKFKKIDRNNGVSTLSYEYYQEDACVNTSFPI